MLQFEQGTAKYKCVLFPKVQVLKQEEHFVSTYTQLTLNVFLAVLTLEEGSALDERGIVKIGDK